MLDHCWTAPEARAFLTAAKAAGPQWAAFFSLALDSGMRRGELCGLKWEDLDLDARRVTIQRQLLKAGPAPTFGLPKTKAVRVVELSADTVALLRVHKRDQAEGKMAVRLTYRDHGLVFAKASTDLLRHGEAPGDPLAMGQINEREFARLVKAAGVRKIKLHGLRHTAQRYYSRPACRPCRAEAPRAHEDRDDARHLRARSAGDATGRGREARAAAPRIAVLC